MLYFRNIAYVWSSDFDRSITTLVPLPRVYVFFHALGPPLGHFGNRYLDVYVFCSRVYVLIHASGPQGVGLTPWGSKAWVSVCVLTYADVC